uniref:Uncharacterized protein n=1 Tax=viral metagenome TaxID=1070528 RepID=A0A6M3KU53_9ZZZZ
MKGILFKPDMIKAIVECRKTVTRRRIDIDPLGWDKPFPSYDKTWGFHRKDTGAFGDIVYVRPRYQVGETVYIKEAHKFTSFDFIVSAYVEYKDGESRDVTKFITDGTTVYNQDHPEVHKWRSPLFMPAWAARYFIKITDVRAERTKDITPEDCLLEGIIFAGGCYWTAEDGVAFDTAQEAYFALYDSINGKDAHEKNWDWRYEFSPLQG